MTAADHAKGVLAHLRLPPQLGLAPFMLWGAAVAHARIGPAFVAAFVVLQVCFQGGATAFETHYEREAGLLGARALPRIGPWLLPGSLGLQALGLVLAASIDVRFFVVCIAFAALGALRSHPIPRLKSRPWLGWCAVMIEQGAFAALAGVVSGAQPHVGPETAWGVVAAALLVGAMHPLAGVCQVEEDWARGDRTAALALGRRGACGASIALALLGTTAASTSARLGGRPFDAAVLALAAVPMIAGATWACAPAADGVTSRRVAVVQIATGLAFGAYAFARLA
jgi:hypothetical protein